MLRKVLVRVIDWRRERAEIAHLWETVERVGLRNPIDLSHLDDSARPCTCGSGVPWIECRANTQFCG